MVLSGDAELLVAPKDESSATPRGLEKAQGASTSKRRRDKWQMAIVFLSFSWSVGVRDQKNGVTTCL
jgi:hypothetical protein